MRNYAEDTLVNAARVINCFILWAGERDLTKVSQITRPVLEAYQLSLSKQLKSNGKRLSWRTQHSMLNRLKHWFRWMTYCAGCAKRAA